MQPVSAAETAQDKAGQAGQETVAASPESQKKSAAFEYTGVSRRDPFTSLIQPKKVGKIKGATPLQSYDAADMQVIAILWMNNKYSAVLSMPDRKSYTVYEGVKVGLNSGFIKKIKKDSVVIADRVKDARGKYSPIERVLKLRMEEE